jgi:hypothetical protein
MFAAAALAAGLAACRTIVRPRALRWGATQDEVTRPMPGDPIVRTADFVATRAITIDVAPGQVWPWLVQIGSGRAGWYSYDRVDNAGRPQRYRNHPRAAASAGRRSGPDGGR